MPRPNLGPKLVTLRKPGWTRARYYIRWSEGGRSRLHGTGIAAADPDAAAAAQGYFADWLRRRARAARGGPGDPAAVRVADLIEDYVREHGDAVAAPATLRFAARPILHFFRADTVASLTPTRVRAYWDWRRNHSIRVLDAETGSVEVIPRGVGDGTIVRELAGTLRPALAHAVKQRRLAAGTYHIPAPPSPAGRDFWLTRGAAARVLRAARRDKRARLHLPLYILIALYTGQRRGAILELTWRQVDLVRGTIDFNPPGRTQTKKRRPLIPAPRPLLAALRRAQRRAGGPYVVAWRGEPLRDVKTGLASAARHAGVPRCTSHTFRHTAGTWMAQQGVPLWEIAGYLGHSTERATALYAHHHPDFMARARRAMERRRPEVSGT